MLFLFVCFLHQLVADSMPLIDHVSAPFGIDIMLNKQELYFLVPTTVTHRASKPPEHPKVKFSKVRKNRKKDFLQLVIANYVIEHVPPP